MWVENYPKIWVLSHNFLGKISFLDILKNRLKSDKDLVAIWDPPVKSDIGFVITVVELLITGYLFFYGFVLGLKGLII
jgi:hypothetical protein